MGQLTDEDELLLAPGGRRCAIGQVLDQLTDEQRAKVAEALTRDRREVPAKNVAEYVRRKTGQPINNDTFAKHVRGACGCPK